ncbi:MAG: hypothetical protein IPG04_07790 [Polyangiaceae bacterium]|nr:hypothetical protein [Polyangiaceae bacterium]
MTSSRPRCPNTVQGTPIFRGFYFTSGTQEGRLMDRVLERMSAAMGIRATAQNSLPDAGAAAARRRVEEPTSSTTCS